MFDYLQKFNNLPKGLRDKVSSPQAMRTISELENIYKVNLAAVIMKIMTKVLTMDSLLDYFISEIHLNSDQAESLKSDLIKNILSPVSDYLEIGLKQKDVHFSADNLLNSKSNSQDYDLINEIGISLASSDLHSRLINIITTYLKGVRSKIVTKEALMKKVEFGGLGLDSEEAERVIEFVESRKVGRETSSQEFKVEDLMGAKILEKTETKDSPNKSEISSKDKLNKIIMDAEGGGSSGYSLKNSILEKKADKILLDQKDDNLLLEEKKQKLLVPNNLPLDENDQTEKKLEVEKEIKDEVDNKQIEEAIKEINSDIVKKKELESKLEIKSEVKTEPKIEIKEKILEPVKDLSVDKANTLNLNFNRPALSSSRPKIQDIKPVIKVISPIDELRLLDLTNFHRLGETTREIVLKIFSKIKLLERDGYDKMVEGVKAWRQSEVNRLYIKMGQEIIMKNISLEEVISERKKKNLPHLKTEEINAISQLNSRLSF